MYLSRRHDIDDVVAFRFVEARLNYSDHFPRLGGANYHTMDDLATYAEIVVHFALTRGTRPERMETALKLLLSSVERQGDIAFCRATAAAIRRELFVADPTSR